MDAQDRAHHTARDTRKTILVVDDAPINRVVLCNTFSAYYNVLQAADGVDALTALRAHPVDVVILDLMMPRMDGYEVLREMKKDAELSLIPVIVVTGADDDEREVKALDCGAQDIIDKPFKPGVMLRRVSNLLAMRDALTAARRGGDRRDGVTGLLSRAAFLVEISARVRQKPVGAWVVSSLDIDNFKVINDRFGHDEGDRLLRYTARALREEADAADGLACRDMADVFLTLLPNDDIALRAAMERVQACLKAYDLPTRVEVHLGHYVVDDLALNVNQMLDRALLAVESVKATASERVAWFDEGMRKKLLREQELTDEMHGALASGQFILYFQPQTNYATRKISGAEVLVRWKHPKKGVISPGEFIPLFERNGFITEMDAYVWEQACRYLRKWLDAGLTPVPLSVNISRRDIQRLDLPAFLRAMIEKYRLSPSLLHLEITESAYVDHPQELIQVVGGMQKQGFTVEMDDFGEGYSSLNILKDVPVDILKLDMKFIGDTGMDTRGGSILTSVVRMAHWLRLPVIAEGVETKRQADYLKSIGCLLMQGFYFSGPVCAEEYEARFVTGAFVPATERDRAGGAEAKGSAEFLDASTQATLLFNSFVGAALIAEYDGENLEYLRCNDRFFEEVGCAREDYEDKRMHVLDRFYPASRIEYVRALEEAESTGEEAQCELHSMPIEAAGNGFWTVLRIRFLARSVQRSLYYISVENVTQRKELEAMRLRLDSIVRHVPAGIAIFEWDARRKPVFVSDKACALFGRAPDDADRVGETLLTLLAGCDAPRWENPVDWTFPARREDGAWFYLRVNASLCPREGKAPLLYATLFDVTKQRESDEELVNMIAFMPGGVFKSAVGEGEKVAFMSDNLLEMAGYTRREFEERFDGRFSQMAYHGDRERVRQTVARQFAQTNRCACEYRIMTRDGGLKWIYAVGHRVRGADGREWIYTVVVDRDERKRLEEALEQKNKQAEALIANTPGGVATYVIRDGVPVREYVSEGFARLFGCAPEALRARFKGDLYAYVHPEDRAGLEDAVSRAVRGGVTLRARYRVRRADETYIWVDLTGNPAVGGDGLTRFFCSYTDITDLMRHEQSMAVERQKTKYALRIADAAAWEYDMTHGELRKLDDGENVLMPPVMENAPESPVACGLVEPESAKEYIALHDSLRAGAERASANVRMKYAPGEQAAWFRVTYTAVFSEGRPVSAVGSAVNISREIADRTRIREMEMAMDIASLYFWTFDCAARALTPMNENARRFQGGGGVSTEALLREGGDEFAAFVRDIRAGSRAQGEITVRMAAPRSGVEWMRVHCAPIHDDGGNVAALAVVGEDVTEATNGERRLRQAQEREKTRESERNMRIVSEHSDRLIYYYDIASGAIHALDAGRSVEYGIPPVIENPERIVSSGAIAPESVADFRGFFRAIDEGEERGVARLRLASADGAPRWADFRFTTVFENGRPTGAVLSGLDVTEAHECELAYERDLLDPAARGGRALFVADITANVVEKQAGDLFRDEAGVAGKPYEAILALCERRGAVNEDGRGVEIYARERVQEMWRDGRRALSNDWRVRGGDGEERWKKVSMRLASEPYTGHLKAYIQIVDITEEKRGAIEALRVARLDGLTGLYNRAYAEKRIRAALRDPDNGRCALVMLDLDDLKGINDSMGHVQGDKALRGIAAALKAQFRSDDILTRIGGDEFMAFLRALPADATLRGTMTGLLNRIADMRTGEHNDIPLHCSIGGTFGVAGRDDFETLYRQADMALYRVKRNGKNDYAFFTPDDEG